MARETFMDMVEESLVERDDYRRALERITLMLDSSEGGSEDLIEAREEAERVLRKHGRLP
jgi:hypothetical protein